MMSNKWISHYNENNSNSTGQMICLRHVFKIRTFRKEADKRTLYVIAFENDVMGNNSNVAWQYNSRNEAEDMILRIVAGVEGFDFEKDDCEKLKTSKLYLDLTRGFDGIAVRKKL
jgi:hypothetical protein